MIIKATMAQTKLILKRKEAICVFYALLIMVLANFIGNVLDFQGSYVSNMCHPMRLLLLSYDMTDWSADGILLFIQVYPLLVACAAGFSLAGEYRRGTQVFLVSRLGNRSYYVSKYLAVFLATMIIFSAPFLLEILLNCVSFPLSATGNLANEAYYSYEYRDAVEHYLMKGLFLYSPYLYAIVGTLFFGAVSGLLGVFTAAVSSLIRVKYMVFLFLPVFVGLNLLSIVGSRFPREAPSILWYDYLLLFDDQEKSPVFLAAGLFVLILFSVTAACISGKRDCLS